MELTLNHRKEGDKTVLEVGGALVFGLQSTGRLVTIPNHRLISDTVLISAAASPFGRSVSASRRWSSEPYPVPASAASASLPWPYSLTIMSSSEP